MNRRQRIKESGDVYKSRIFRLFESSLVAFVPFCSIASLFSAVLLFMVGIAPEDADARAPSFTWDAKAITPAKDMRPGEVDDYFAAAWDDVCDFDEGDNEGIVYFGEGLQDVKVAEGALSFLTGEKDNVFFWGNHDRKHPEARTEKLGFNWPAAPRWHWEARIRMRQSLPRSKWVFVRQGLSRASRMDIPSGRIRSVNFSVTGTEWQTVRVPVRGIHTGFGRYLSFGFETSDEGNRVEIDKIEFLLLKNDVSYESTMVVDGKVRDAELVVMASPSYTLEVNGRTVRDDDLSSFSGPYERVNIAPFLKEGENRLRVGTKCMPENRVVVSPLDGLVSYLPPPVLVEGLVTYTGGRMQRIRSDETWQASADGGPWEPALVSGWSGRRPPYFGLLGLDYGNRRSPVYGEDEGIGITISVPQREDSVTLSYELRNSFVDGDVKEGMLNVTSSSGNDAVYEFVYSPPAPGVWTLNLMLKDKNGNAVDRRSEEVAVVGKLPMKEVEGKTYTEGMDLRHIVSIDCTDPNDPHPFMDGGRGKRWESRVVDSGAGTYRQTGEDIYSWFSYAFCVSNTCRPHLVEVTYPDDKERTLGLRIGEARDYDMSLQRMVFATYTGGDRYPLSGESRKLYGLYWPNQKVGTVEIVAMDSANGGAASHINLYEIGALPAMRVRDDAGRFIGQMSERAYLSIVNFYCGEHWDGFVDPYWANNWGKDFPYLYDAWYTTCRNFTEYMRFSGQNVYIASVNSYNNCYFPTRNFMRDPIVDKDHLDLMAKFFEYNGIKLIPGFQIAGTYKIYEMDDATDQDLIERGYLGDRVVSSEGGQVIFGNSQHGFNYLDPRVKKEIFSLIGEVIDLYKDYPAFSGIYFHGSGWTGPGLITGYDANLPALAWGYSDTTIRLFEEDTGMKVPVPKTDSDKFQKRYDWLTSAENREKWIEWRCQKNYGQFSEIAEMLRAARPDLKLFVCPSVPAAYEWRQWKSGDMTYEEGARYSGYDLKMLSAIKNMVLIRSTSEAIGKWQDTDVALKKVRSEKVSELFDMDNFGQMMGRHFPEPTMRTDKKWFWKRTPAAFWGKVLPDRYFGSSYVESLRTGVPCLIYFEKADCNLFMGGEQGLRNFSKVYRTLPQGDYETLSGDGLDGVIVVRRTKTKEGSHVYVLNPFFWTVRTKLRFKPGTEVVNAATGSSVPLKDGVARLTMGSYSVLSLRCSGDPVSAETEISKDGMAFLREHVSLSHYVELVERLEEQKKHTAFSSEHPFSNGGFEEGVDAWTVSEPSSVKIVDGYEGKSLHFEHSEGEVCASQVFDGLKPATYYDVRFAAKADGVDGIAFVELRKYGLELIRGEAEVSSEENGGEWRQYEFLFRAEGEDLEVRLSLGTKGSGTGSVSFDNVRIVENDGLPNRVSRQLPGRVREIVDAWNQGQFARAYELADASEFRALVAFAEERY